MKIVVFLCLFEFFVSGQSATEYVLYDFTNSSDPTIWTEQSDTVRTVGLSKAAFTLFENSSSRRAVFFALLNPLPSGAGFAGMRDVTNHDVSAYDQFQIHCRAQGEHNSFKVVLRHKGLNSALNNTFEQFFDGPKENFTTVTLPFSDFKPYFRGVLLNETIDIDFSRISSIGLQFYAGIYQPIKQKGPATLEVDWIKASLNSTKSK